MLTPDVHEIPGLSEAKVGWRAWWVVSGRLTSIDAGDIWTPRRAMVAKCRYGCLTSPGEGCGCGLGAIKELDDLLRLGYPRAGGEVCAIGQVALWGRVVEGMQGWRASRAYPVRVLLPYGVPALARDIRDAYACKVGFKNFHIGDTDEASD